MKRVASTLAKSFVCELCVDTQEEIVKPSEEISYFDQVDFVKSFCYLEDRLNARGGSKAAVTARTKIGWLKFRECGELLNRRKFSLKMNERICWRCVRCAVLYWRETWCLR